MQTQDILNQQDLNALNQQEISLRQYALTVANQKSQPDASIEDLLKDAEKLMVFLRAGVKLQDWAQDG